MMKLGMSTRPRRMYQQKRQGVTQQKLYRLRSELNKCGVWKKYGQKPCQKRIGLFYSALSLCWQAARLFSSRWSFFWHLMPCASYQSERECSGSVCCLARVRKAI